MHVRDASPAMFSYFTIAEELAQRGFTVHFNGLHIGTDDIAEVQMVVLDDRRIWVELTVTVMPVGDEPRHAVTAMRVDEGDTDSAKNAANKHLHAALADGPLNAVRAADVLASAVEDINTLCAPTLEEEK